MNKDKINIQREKFNNTYTIPVSLDATDIESKVIRSETTAPNNQTYKGIVEKETDTRNTGKRENYKIQEYTKSLHAVENKNVSEQQAENVAESDNKETLSKEERLRQERIRARKEAEAALFTILFVIIIVAFMSFLYFV